MKAVGLRRSKMAATIAAACGAMVLWGAGSARADLAGFADFQLNGGATVSGDSQTLTITDGGGSEARSAFSTAQQSVNNFVANFVYTDVGGGGADGFAFVLQNDPRGAGAVGDPGGSLGYGGAAPIQPSGAVAFNIYGPNGGSQSGYNINGNHSYYPTGPVDITSGNPINVTFIYNGQTLTEVLADTVAGTTNTKTYTANIPFDAGGASAYIGFTGGTGGATSTQTISSFSYVTGAAPAPRPMAPIAATGYNRDVIVEASATPDVTTGFSGAVSATVDAGDAKTGATFYETGLAGSSLGVATGTTLTSAADTHTTFRIQPGTGNNALQVNTDNPAGTLTLDTPRAYSLLAVFATTGSGSNPAAPMTIHFSNGAPDLTTTYYAPDWFGNSQYALSGLDRVVLDTGAFDNNADNPRIYQTTIDLAALGHANDPVASIDFSWGGSGNTEIFGISGAATVPEPATLGLFGLAALGLLVRRRSPR